VKKKFILTLGLCGLLLVTGCTDSNEDKDKNKDNEENRSYASKVTCEAENAKYIFYFDKNDQLESFDLYSTINIGDFDMSEKEIKEQAEDICNGDGEFPKEWMDECGLTNEGDVYTLHAYINNNKWVEDMTDKKELIEYAEENGLESPKLTCK